MPVFLRAVPVWAWAAGLVAVSLLYMVGKRSVKPAAAAGAPRPPSLLQFAAPEGTSGEVGIGGSPILNPALAGQSEGVPGVTSSGQPTSSSTGAQQFFPTASASTYSSPYESSYYMPVYAPSSPPTYGGGGQEPPGGQLTLSGDTGRGTGGISAVPVAAQPGGSTPVFQGANARVGGGKSID